MRDALKKKFHILLTKKYQISLAVLIPAFFVLFAFGPLYVSITSIEQLLYKGDGLPPGLLESLQQTVQLLRRLMWLSISVALVAGLFLAYSILAPVRKYLEEAGSMTAGGPAAEPAAEFTLLGRDFSMMMGSLGQYVSIIEGMSGGVIVFDREGCVTAMNPSAEHIFGRRSRELIGKNLVEICRGVVHSPLFEQVIRDGLSSDRQYASEEIRLSAPGRNDLVIGMTTSLLKDTGGKTSGLVATFMDMTGVKQMHDDLQRKLRLASLGRLAAGVAHEVRNPLGAIKGMAQLIQEGLPEDDRRKKYGGVIEQEANRLNRVVEDLLGLAHGPEEPRLCDLRTLVVHARDLASAVLGGKEIEVLDETAPVPDIVAERERLVQVFLNIFLNAFEAVPAGGRVRYRTSFLQGQDSVCVEIGNTGPSMSLDVKEHLFEPFFSTKERGSGLGLAIVHQIVTAHGGAVSVENANAETVFRVVLPVMRPGPRTA